MKYLAVVGSVMLLCLVSATRAEDPAPAAKPEEAPAFDLERLTALLGEFDAALYASDQEAVAEAIAKPMTARAAEALERFRAAKPPRAEFLRLLGFARTDEARAEARKFLASADASERAAAAFAAGVGQDKESVARLTAMLDDSEPKVARQAAMALGRLREAGAYDALEARLDSKDPMMRLAAVKALGLMGDERAKARLEDYLRTHDDPIETVAVLDALNLIAGDDVARILAQLERVAGALEQCGTGLQTQIAQAAVTDAFDRMVRKAEEQSQQKPKPKQKRRTSKEEQQQQQSSQQQQQNGSNPAQQTQMNPAAQMDAVLAEIRRSAGAVWGSLPPAMQEEVTAALKQELPERYQPLLKAYYKILAEGK
jgi:HEAT repeat protein